MPRVSRQTRYRDLSGIPMESAGHGADSWSNSMFLFIVTVSKVGKTAEYNSRHYLVEADTREKALDVDHPMKQQGDHEEVRSVTKLRLHCLGIHSIDVWKDLEWLRGKTPDWMKALEVAFEYGFRVGVEEIDRDELLNLVDDAMNQKGSPYYGYARVIPRLLLCVANDGDAAGDFPTLYLLDRYTRG